MAILSCSAWVPLNQTPPIYPILNRLPTKTQPMQVMPNTLKLSHIFFFSLVFLCLSIVLIQTKNLDRLTPNLCHFYIPHDRIISVDLTTSATGSTSRHLLSSVSLGLLSSSLTPHIHLHIIRSALSKRSRSSDFIGHVSLQYTSMRCTQAR